MMISALCFRLIYCRKILFQHLIQITVNHFGLKTPALGKTDNLPHFFKFVFFLNVFALSFIIFSKTVFVFFFVDFIQPCFNDFIR